MSQTVAAAVQAVIGLGDGQATGNAAAPSTAVAAYALAKS
jgi:hypothetical protein